VFCRHFSIAYDFPVQTELTNSSTAAAEFIRRGGVVAFPTETVYGLGANVFDGAAVRKIFEAKMRPADNPLIAHVASPEQIFSLASEVTPAAAKLIERFFPGPLTVVLPRAPKVPDVATAGLDTIGVRMPRNEFARAFLAACGTPVAAPSANVSGRPSPTTWRAVLEDLDGRIDCILQGEATEIGLESTVVDCTGDTPLILRAGAVSVEELQAVVPTIKFYSASSGEPARSPGLKHRHYSPKARVSIISPGDVTQCPEQSAYIGVDEPGANFAKTRICADVEDYARNLFAFFRGCDAEGIKQICCQEVDETGIGRALMDRIRRAAE